MYHGKTHNTHLRDRELLLQPSQHFLPLRVCADSLPLVLLDAVLGLRDHELQPFNLAVFFANREGGCGAPATRDETTDRRGAARPFVGVHAASMSGSVLAQRTFSRRGWYLLRWSQAHMGLSRKP